MAEKTWADMIDEEQDERSMSLNSVTSDQIGSYGQSYMKQVCDL
jgi:hypothetical protein